jgi:hypothetical protein
LPYTWVQEQGRLCCRLRQLAPEQRQWLESEHVADFPEVELRILALPRVRPLLAEVIFPPSMTIEQAKGYIYQELQEMPMQAAERSLHWADEPDRLALCLCPGENGREATIALEPGVRELVATAVEEWHGQETVPQQGQAPVSQQGPEAVSQQGQESVPQQGTRWYTRRLEFERGAGWNRHRAEEWLHTHLSLRDLGRTALLETPYRMTPGLAAILSDLLFEGGYRSPPSPAHHPVESNPSAVDFVVVPPLARKRDASPPREQERRARPPSRSRAGASSRPVTQAGERDDAQAREHDDRAAAPSSAAPLPRAGAGLEQDLAVARHGDRLPTEFRAELPRQGLVNYLEAQAVVRKLEELASRPPVASGPIAVIALYAAQADLIRRLIGRSAKLAPSGLRVDTGPPEAFRQREYDVVLVSLTRSHSHRAVSYGPEAHLLGLALTRARTRLIVFGDVGTLVRRTQWDGVLDHLDEAAAAREGQVIGQLLNYLHGRGRHVRGFRLCEGGSP